MQPLLDIRNLTVHFHTMDGTVHAVNGISLSLDKGETLGIVGESGCGKSVSMLSVMRLIPNPPGEIVAGEVLYGENDLLKMDLARIERIRGKQIAMIFQDPMTSLNPVLPIGFQIGEVLEVHDKLSRQEARRRAVALLDLVGIPEADQRYYDYPHQFSGGMRQRAMIAMALAGSPDILIADEPTTALDVTIQAQIIDLVKDLRRRLGMSVIWITHDLSVVAELADRVVVMYAGFIVEQAGVDALFEDPRHPYTLALLKSLPRVDCDREEKLANISGMPPDCLDLPPGCPFLPRCQHAIERCSRENPPLAPVEPNHSIACWIDTQTGAER